MNWPWTRKPSVALRFNFDDVPCRVRGVWGTAHLERGDVDSGPPERVDIECGTVTFTFPVGRMPYSGKLEWVTVHMGEITARCRVDPPMTVLKGDYLYIVQPVAFQDLGYVPGKAPGCGEAQK
ncbi:MAG: hypothetical protein V1912_11355 [bacterium]